MVVSLLAATGAGSYWFGRSTPIPNKSEQSPVVVEVKKPEEFRERLRVVIETAVRISSACKGGVTFESFSDQTAKLQGDVELAKAVWPADQYQRDLKGIQQLAEVCMAARNMWAAKIRREDDAITERQLKEVLQKISQLIDATTPVMREALDS